MSTSKNDIRFFVGLGGFLGLIISLSNLKAIFDMPWTVVNFLPNLGGIAVWVFGAALSAVVLLAAISERDAIKTVAEMFRAVLRFLNSLRNPD